MKSTSLDEQNSNNNNNNNNNSVTNKLLLIVQFNDKDLKNHVNELKTVLYNRRIVIALIIETHFTKYSNIFIASYKLLKPNHPYNTTYGGGFILMKTSIFFEPLPNFV